MNPDLIDPHLDNFACRCFRDTADGDYISARIAYRADLIQQALWASQQTLEKYIKCILLLRRVAWTKSSHSLLKPLQEIEKTLPMDLSPETRRFIEHIEIDGPDRYLTYPYAVNGDEIIRLDRAVWEIRRYCIFYSRFKRPRGAELERANMKNISESTKRPPQAYRPFDDSGLLDSILDGRKKHPARPFLIWNNLCFGNSRRKTVNVIGPFQSVNSPIALYPEILEEVAKYVYLPKEVRP
jgi:HEPN domain-containing protein